MDADFLLLTQSALGTLYVIMDGEGDLTNGLLHLVHADVAVEVAQDVIERALFRNIAPDIVGLHHHGIGATADERREDVFRRLDGNMGIAEGLVLDLDLILEEALQLMLGFWGVGCHTILGAQLQLTDVAEVLIARSGQTERVLEAVLGCRVGHQEVVETLGESGNDDDGILVPLVHLDKQLVEGVHLVGIAVGQQFLHIVEEEYSSPRLLHVVIPLVDKTLVVDGIDHRQLGLLDNLMLVEIVADDFSQGRLTRSRFTYYYSIDAQTNVHHVLARMQVSIRVDDGLQLLLHLVEPHHAVEHVLRSKRMTTPLTELSYRAVFFMTMLAYHTTLHPFVFV